LYLPQRFHSRAPLAPNSSDHNHSSRGQGGVRGQISKQIRYCSFFSGEIDARVIAHPSQSRRVNPMLPVGTSILRHAVLRAAHRPCGSRCSRLPLRVFGNAARYRRSVFAARRQVQAVRGSSTRSPARESHELWPTRAMLGARTHSRRIGFEPKVTSFGPRELCWVRVLIHDGLDLNPSCKRV
jgi:hypothetical protein